MKDTEEIIDDMSILEEFNNIPLNLEILAEECAEIIKIKSKIIRFGLEETHPNDDTVTNKDKLEKEIGHFLLIMEILISNGVVTKKGIDAGMDHKLDKLPKWYTYKGE